MSDALSSTVASQTITALKRENAQLHKTINEMFRENQLLKKQSFHTTAALDVAVAKLNALGVSLDPPLDLRALRAEVKAVTVTAWTSEGQLSASEGLEPQLKSQVQSTQQRKFRLQSEMKEHSRSVLCAAFAVDDQQAVIATGGLDKKIVLSNFMTGLKVSTIEGHDHNISDIQWISTQLLLSASFDCTAKVWDVSAGQLRVPLYTLQTKGFALSCCAVTDRSCPTATPLFAVTDSKKCINVCDTRAPATRAPTSWECATRANSVTCDGSHRLITGHTNGVIALWDLRMTLQAIEELAETPKSPQKADNIPSLTDATPPRGAMCPAKEWANETSSCSVLHVSHYLYGDDERKILVVSDDNMARLYSSRVVGIEGGAPKQEDYQLENVISGVQTRSFNARGSLWRGKREKRSLYDDNEAADSEPATRRLQESDLVVICGGENYASVFDVTNPQSQPSLVQRLEGHRGRVCGVAMHRSETKPIVATLSEDSTVKIWVPGK